jgi:hypothetical protein
VAPRQRLAGASTSQAVVAPVGQPPESDPPEAPETPAEEAEQAQALTELCAEAGLAHEGLNTPEEMTLDRELQQSCAESGVG